MAASASDVIAPTVVARVCVNAWRHTASGRRTSCPTIAGSRWSCSIDSTARPPVPIVYE